MNVLVAGGGSKVGQHLVERLRAEGHAVDVLSRSGAIRGDITDPPSLKGVCDGRDVVVSLVGASIQPVPRFPDTSFEAVDRDGNLALLDEAVRAGVPRFVYLSVFGDYPPGVAYVEAHRAVEEALAKAPITWTAVRPTGFFGSFDLLRPWARLGIGVRIGSGEVHTNPIHEADLADVIAEHLAEGPEIVDCGGPEVLTRNAITRRLAGGRVLLIPLPAFFVDLNAALIRPFNRRIADLTVFFRHVLTHEGVAPQHGTRRL
ncbi:MAG: NAD(P)H-binding protein [Alphaproteobacteria bacterium]|nr:NAD(P)H-binding protein [Alphaproteobacteria bacterium]